MAGNGMEIYSSLMASTGFMLMARQAGRVPEPCWGNPVGSGAQFKHLQYGHGKQNAAHACHSGQHYAFCQYLRQDVGRCGSYGSSYADFGGSLAHGHHHYVRHTDGSGQQCAYAHEPYQKVHTVEQIVEHHEHHLGVEYSHALFVGGINRMSPCHHFAHAVGQ